MGDSKPINKKLSHPGEKNGNWRGGKYTERGYVHVRASNHPNKNHNGYVREHRLIMEAYLGRYLRPKEDVHHINGNRSDNRIENLELISRGKHASLHHTIPLLSNLFAIKCLDCERMWCRKWYYADGGRICSYCYNKRFYLRQKLRRVAS